MSQAGVFDKTTVAPDVETLTGNTGGPVPPTAFNINIVGSSTSGLTFDGNPATSTITVNSLSPFFEATVTTTDDTPTPILSVPIGESTATVVECRVVGYTAGNALGGLFSFLARRNGGNSVVVGLPDFMKDVPSALSGAGYSAAGVANDAVISVTGVAATTIYWKVQADVTFVSAP